MAKGDPDIEIKVGSKADTGGFRETEGWIGKIRSAFQTLVGEFAGAEKAVNSLDRALQKQGTLTTDYRKRLQELAGEMQDLTAIADDEWIDAITRLTQFGVGPDRMEEVLKVTKDVAGIFKGDLSAATDAVTRALGGQYMAFTRLGLQIDQNASQLDKWRSLAEQAAKIGGGQLEGMAEGTEGALKQLSNAISDAKEALGGLLVRSGLVIPPLKSLAGAIKFVSDGLGGLIDRAEGVHNIWQRDALSLEEAAQAAEKYAKQIDAINKASAAMNKQLDAEQTAAEAVKSFEDAQAKAKHDALLRFIDAKPGLSDERRAELKAKATQDFEDDQTRRDLDFKAGTVLNLEARQRNEESKVAAARSMATRLEADVRRQAGLDRDLSRKTLPLQKELVRLESGFPDFLPNLDTKNFGPMARRADEEDFRRERIAELEAQIQQVKDGHAAQFGRRDPGLAGRAREARANAETIAAEWEGRKFDLGAQVGRARMNFDARSDEAGWARVAQLIEQSSGATGQGQQQMIQALQRNIGVTERTLQGQADIWQRIRQLEAQLNRMRN